MSSSGTVVITGGSELAAKLRGLGDPSRVGHAVGAALYQEAETIMADSKTNYVPVDVGTLHNSGHVQMPEISGSKASVLLGFGGAASDYALAVHENLTARHTVGQAKYLEKPMLAAARGMTDRLGRRIRSELGI